jgi:hypothetical protein
VILPRKMSASSQGNRIKLLLNYSLLLDFVKDRSLGFSSSCPPIWVTEEK